MRFIKKISLLGLLFFIPLISHAQDYTEGKHYTKLTSSVSTQNPEKIEVLEFFWYGCPHCFQFEPTLRKWKQKRPANVEFIRVPAPLNPSWMVHTKAYYTLQIMGEGEKHHDAIFDAMHNKKIRLHTKDSMADFLAAKGVDKAVFLSTFDSFAVSIRVNKALQLGKDFKVSGVPMLAVNGKYTISGSQAGSYAAMIKITEYLIKQESK